MDRRQAHQDSLFEKQAVLVYVGLPEEDQRMALRFRGGGPYLCERCADYLARACQGAGLVGWQAVRACVAETVR